MRSQARRTGNARAVGHRIVGAYVVLALLGLLLSSAEAQQGGRFYRIGVLHEAYAPHHPAVEGLKAGLKEIGFEEDHHVAFDIRFTEGNPQILPAAAAALVAGGMDLIFTSGEAATQAAKEVTQKISIVFTVVGDPVAAGLIKEVARPGGNITGVSSLTTRLAPKRLETLKALVPDLRRVWAIYHADDPSSLAAARAVQEAAPRLQLELVSRSVRTHEEFAHALAALQPGDGLLPPDIATLDIPAQILRASLAAQVPVVFSSAFWIGYGGLLSYGADYHAEGRQAAWLVAKILRGAHPRDLPVEGANRIELAVNLRTATRLGLTIPRKILVRADRVIE
jgi:putative ABC transport system substrate-binding protein